MDTQGESILNGGAEPSLLPPVSNEMDVTKEEKEERKRIRMEKREKKRKEKEKRGKGKEESS